MASSIGPAGDRVVILDKFELRSPRVARRENTAVPGWADLRTALIRLDIYEDMFSPTLTAQAEIQDTINLSTGIPLVGFESILVSFHLDRDSGPRSYTFPLAVYNQSDRVLQTQGTEKYTLGLASPELIISTSRKLSFAFTNRRMEDIIRELVTSPDYLSSKKKFDLQ